MLVETATSFGMNHGERARVLEDSTSCDKQRPGRSLADADHC